MKTSGVEGQKVKLIILAILRCFLQQIYSAVTELKWLPQICG